VACWQYVSELAQTKLVEKKRKTSQRLLKVNKDLALVECSIVMTHSYPYIGENEMVSGHLSEK